IGDTSRQKDLRYQQTARPVLNRPKDVIPITARQHGRGHIPPAGAGPSVMRRCAKRGQIVQIWRRIMKALIAALALVTLIAVPTCAPPANAAPMSPASAETARQDARLNENYKRLMSKVSAKRKKTLLEAQRAGIKFRDVNCSFYYDPDGGTAARLAGSDCFLQATADRAKELKNLTNDEQLRKYGKLAFK